MYLYRGRVIPARVGKGLTASDLSIAIETADDLGDFLLQKALVWDWGSWPKGSPQSSDPDLGKSWLFLDLIYIYLCAKS